MGTNLMNSATVIDLSTYRERRRADSASRAVGAIGPSGLVPVMVMPVPCFFMWSPFWVMQGPSELE